RQLSALRRARRSQNGRDERSGRTARPDLPYSTDDGSALAVTASAPRRVCQPSASPLRCGARVAERPRAAAGNRRSVFAWSENLGQPLGVTPPPAAPQLGIEEARLGAALGSGGGYDVMAGVSVAGSSFASNRRSL